mmetsp:Transcript_95500/g.208799  ORF Transcript_95500/g.208799 Transcript_95500/m.208799 type:complete len:109 (-) Transcript_95500:306-632(-)
MPTQLPSHEQWWSNRKMHRSQRPQCFARKGRQILQVVHHLCFRTTPFTQTCLQRKRDEELVTSGASSKVRELGTTPGFLPDAASKLNMAPMAQTEQAPTWDQAIRLVS